MTMSPGSPADPGLQPERTELAWRRTALALAIGSLLSLRVFPLVLPPPWEAWGLLPGGVGVVAAGVLWFTARRRQQRQTSVLRGDGTMGPGGGMLVALTGLTVAFGLAAVALVALVPAGG